MNSKPITSYEDLCKERERLTELLKAQKIQIQRDVDNLKDEFRPVVNLSENVSKILSREDGKDPLMTAGTNITIDILVAKLFSKSNFLLKMILPALLKNLSSHYIPKALPAKKQIHSTQPSLEQTVVQKTVVVNREKSLYREHADDHKQAILPEINQPKVAKTTQGR
jgi:hypothetical protein